MRDDYVALINQISKSTFVELIVDPTHESVARDRLRDCPGVRIHVIEHNDVWIRDFGPSFVRDDVNGKLNAISWRYNAWGGKYPPWENDDRLAEYMADHADVICVQSDLCLEGGAIEIDGRGRMITTPSCLITETRNPGWTKARIAREFHSRLGVEEIVWMDGGGLIGDDTDGHVDQLARFINPEVVVVATADEHDDNHGQLRQNQLQLELWGGQTMPRIDVHALRIPPPRFIDDQRVPESYCNFVRLGLDRIMMPTFDAETDEPARRTLERLSGCTVETFDCRNLVWGLGSLHCCTREQPLA